MKRAESKDLSFTLVRRLHDEDEVQEQFRPLKWGLVRRVFTYARPAKMKMAMLIGVTLIRSAQIPSLVGIIAFVITGPIAKGNLRAIALGTLGYAILAAFTDGLLHFRQRYALEIGETMVNALRSDIFEKMQRQPMSFFHRMKVGRIISRVTSDVEALRVGIQDVAFVCAMHFGQMVFAAFFMAWWDWRLFLVAAAMAPILGLANNHFRMKYSRLTRASQESFSRVTATLAESVGGIRVTQGFVRQETNADLFRNLLADHSRFNIGLARVSAILSSLFDLNSQFFVAILLLLGGWRVFHGSMEIANLIRFFLMANQFFSPIVSIGTQYNQALLAMASAERIFWLIDFPLDWSDAAEAVDLTDPRAGPSGPGLGASAEQALGATVEFRRVVFGYDPKRPVLHDITFRAERGQSLALVGYTGSGKSSIINLASKFYLPTQGEVLIDGRDVRTITSHSLHRQMGIVQQQNFLFSGTVLSNILLSRPEASEKEVRAAAGRLDCLDILEALPKGLHTEVGERGASLSLGQRQLICFCRALLADPRLVILDEATSSIDALTERRLQNALVTLLKGRTSFMVAHRLSTIRHASLVLVLDQGRIIERGTHSELLAAGGHYGRLYRQFIQVDDRARV